MVAGERRGLVGGFPMRILKGAVPVTLILSPNFHVANFMCVMSK
jgi:hypothetical protein